MRKKKRSNHIMKKRGRKKKRNRKKYRSHRSGGKRRRGGGSIGRGKKKKRKKSIQNGGSGRGDSYILGPILLSQVQCRDYAAVTRENITQSQNYTTQINIYPPHYPVNSPGRNGISGPLFNRFSGSPRVRISLFGDLVCDLCWFRVLNYFSCHLRQ